MLVVGTGANFTAILRRVILFRQPTLCSGFDVEGVGLCAINGDNDVVIRALGLSNAGVSP